jgi:hypothetical protein
VKRLCLALREIAVAGTLEDVKAGVAVRSATASGTSAMVCGVSVFMV